MYDWLGANLRRRSRGHRLRTRDCVAPAAIRGHRDGDEACRRRLRVFARVSRRRRCGQRITDGGCAGKEVSRLHPNVCDVLADLDQARSVLREAVDGVPPPDRGRRPGEGRWSVNEILEHLSIVERRFTALLAVRIDEAKANGLGAEQDARAPIPAELKKMLTDRANRRHAPEAVHPTATLDNRSAWQAVEDARESLRG